MHRSFINRDPIAVDHKFKPGDRMGWRPASGNKLAVVKGVFLNKDGEPCYEFEGESRGAADLVSYYDAHYDPTPNVKTFRVTITGEEVTSDEVILALGTAKAIRNASKIAVEPIG
jgi:hypothetical protein